MQRVEMKSSTSLGILAVLAVTGGCFALHEPVVRGVQAAEKRPPSKSSSHGTAPVAPQPVSAESAGADLLFYEGFETGKVGPGWTGFALHRRTPRPEESGSVDIVTEPVRKGKYALKLTIRAGDSVVQGDETRDKERCEFLRLNSCRKGPCTLGSEGREGSELWYAWSVLIPEDYKYVDTSAQNYQIMGQWHDQPEPGRKPTGNSPPISVHYHSSGPSQGFRIQYGLRKRGPIQEIEAPIQKGKWVDLMFHIRFSQGSDGFLEAWKDGVSVASASGATRITGPNMFNAQPDYLRLGLYRGRSQTQTNTFYYDEIRIGTTKAAVQVQ
jgi:hypothetical protein